jgi:hypothetical protein
VHSSAADSVAGLILGRLRQDDEAVDGVNPNFLVRNWPPALTEWSTRAVRDAFFASPRFPRLLVIDKLKETIARGVANGMLAYLGKAPDGRCDPFFFEQDIGPEEIELSDDMFIITAEEGRKCIEPPALKYIEVRPDHASVEPGKSLTFTFRGLDQHGQEYSVETVSWSATGGEIDGNGVFHAREEEGEYTVTAKSGPATTTVRVVVRSCQEPGEGDRPNPPPGQGGLKWSGQVPPQKWMHLYSKVLAKFVNAGDLAVTVSFSVSPKGGVSLQQIEETKSALRDIGLSPDVESD